MSNLIDKSYTKHIQEELMKLGLKEKESVVYVSLLKLGEVGASKIVKDTGLHGQFVYDSLTKLIEKDLAQYSIYKGRKKFVAKNLESLASFIDQKKRTADSLIEELRKITTFSDIQQFNVLQGQDAFINNELTTIKSSRENSEVLVIGGEGDDYITNLHKYFNEYEYWRLKKNIKVRYIGSENQKSFLENNSEKRKMFLYKLLPGGFSGKINQSIHDDRICFYLFGSPSVIFSISNEKIAESYKQFFETLWKIAK